MEKGVGREGGREVGRLGSALGAGKEIKQKREAETEQKKNKKKKERNPNETKLG